MLYVSRQEAWVCAGSMVSLQAGLTASRLTAHHQLTTVVYTSCLQEAFDKALAWSQQQHQGEATEDSAGPSESQQSCEKEERQQGSVDQAHGSVVRCSSHCCGESMPAAAGSVQEPQVVDTTALCKVAATDEAAAGSGSGRGRGVAQCAGVGGQGQDDTSTASRRLLDAAVVDAVP